MAGESDEAFAPLSNAPAREYCLECTVAHEVLRQTDAAATDTERSEVLQLL